MSVLRALWAVGRKAVSLGNFLIFRKELELLAKIHKKEKVVIHFVGEEPFSLPAYATDVFVSEIPFELTNERGESYDWPKKEDFFSKETHFTLQKIEELSRGSGFSPDLLWPETIYREAKQRLKKWGGGVVCHLKNAGDCREDSNAHFASWREFFERVRDCPFILVGSDIIPVELERLPHLYGAQREGVSLSVQLALCAVAEGFIGMASGMSAAAILSSSPYVIFKHPSHHPEEMQRELRERDHFGFAHSNQKLLRQLDQFDNIHSAFFKFLRGKEDGAAHKSKAPHRSRSPAP